MQYSNIRADNIKDESGVNAPIFDSNLNFDSTDHLVLPKGTTAQRPSSPSTGAVRFNTDLANVEYYDGTQWIEVNSGNPSHRGVFGGGINPGSSPSPRFDIIEYVSIPSSGTGLYFGDLTTLRSGAGHCASSTRGLFGGGATNPGFPDTSIDYITIATTGNAIDFGGVLTTNVSSPSAISNSTRGVWGGGQVPGGNTNVINYITIASTGVNAIDFGDLTVTRGRLAGCASPTRGIFAGGDLPSPAGQSNVIDYITIATTGNATDFGDLTLQRQYLSSFSSQTRGIIGGGLTTTSSTSSTNIIDYITIATTGNALDFGDLVYERSYSASTCNSIRGIFYGGRDEPSPAVTSNSIDRITIATTGNAVEYGTTLTTCYSKGGGFSNSHGGLS